MSTRQRPPIQALLLDISGTLYVGSTPTPNAVEAYHRLRQSSIPFRLCSNTSKESTASLVHRLNKMGFQISNAESNTGAQMSDRAAQHRTVWTSIGAVAKVVKNMGLKKPLFLLSDSASQEILDAIDGERDDGQLGQLSAYDSVIVGLSPSHFDYSSLNTAFRILKGEVVGIANPTAVKNTGANHSTQVPLIATHKAKYVQTESGLSLGPGPFVTALEHASGVPAFVVGKPTQVFFGTVIQDFTEEELGGAAIGLLGDDNSKGRIAVIGDDVEADLGGGALELGLWRVLVRTGKYRPGDENRQGIVPPDEVFNSFAEFVDSLLSGVGQQSAEDS